ncbi:hypothetical protein VTK56DRAFT_617 [Thermocarpiscus australiensis]
MAKVKLVPSLQKPAGAGQLPVWYYSVPNVLAIDRHSSLLQERHARKLLLGHVGPRLQWRSVGRTNKLGIFSSLADQRKKDHDRPVSKFGFQILDASGRKHCLGRIQPRAHGLLFQWQSKPLSMSQIAFLCETQLQPLSSFLRREDSTILRSALHSPHRQCNPPSNFSGIGPVRCQNPTGVEVTSGPGDRGSLKMTRVMRGSRDLQPSMVVCHQDCHTFAFLALPPLATDRESRPYAHVVFLY